MTTQELENELIELAKQNPIEDYYVGSVGESLRDILKRFMGERYPKDDELDPTPFIPSFECHHSPDQPCLCEESKRIWDAVQEKKQSRSSFFERVIPHEFPEGMGCITAKSLPE